MPREIMPIWGTLVVVGSGFYTLRQLATLVSHERLPISIRKRLAFFGLAPCGARVESS